MNLKDSIGMWNGRLAILDSRGSPVAFAPPGVETFREFEDMLVDLESGKKTYEDGYNDGRTECEKDAEDSYDDGHHAGRIEAERDAALKAADAASPLREALDILTGSEEPYDPDVVRNIKEAMNILEGI